MAISDILQIIAGSRVDAKSLSEFMYKPADFIVQRRLAPPINTLNFYIDRISSVNASVIAVQQSVAAADALIENNATYAADAVNAAIEGVAIDANLVTDALIKTTSGTTQQRINNGLNSVADLSTIQTPYDGMKVYVRSYHSGKNVGGGDFYYDSSRSSDNDGGSVINGFVRVKTKAITPYCFGVLDNVDSGDALQSFFDFVGADTKGYSYDMSCSTITGQLLNLTSSVSTAKTVSGYMQLNVVVDLKDNAAPNLVNLEGLRDWVFLGGFYVNGYSSFTGVKLIINGVMLNDCRRMSIGRVEGRGGEGFLFVMNRETNNNMVTIGILTASNFGVSANLRAPRPYNFLSSSGVATSGAYRSLIDIDLSDVPDVLIESMLVVIDGEPHAVLEYDSVNSIATLFPGFLSTYTHTNTAKLIHGGGLLAHGKDSGELKYSMLTATNCGIAHCDKALYGSVGSRLTTQNCGAAFVVGIPPASVGGFGTQIAQPYTEANDFDFISVSTAGAGYFTTPIALNVQKCRCLSAPALPKNYLSRFIIQGFLSQSPGSRFISTPSAVCLSWERLLVANTPATIYLDGKGASRIDREISLGLEHSQAALEGLHSREIVLYNQIKNYKITASEGYTVNNESELLIPDSPTSDGTVIRAIKINSNWVVTFYSPDVPVAPTP